VRGDIYGTSSMSIKDIWIFAKRRRVSEFAGEIFFTSILAVSAYCDEEFWQDSFLQTISLIIIVGIFIYRCVELARVDARIVQADNEEAET
jgi:hypothetical protein